MLDIRVYSQKDYKTWDTFKKALESRLGRERIKALSGLKVENSVSSGIINLD